MRLHLLAHGLPGEHLGVGHVLKHYLDAHEMWEDIADDVDPELRPRAFLAARAHPELVPADHWPALCAVHDRAYGGIVTALCAATPSPPGGRWVPTRGRRHRTHVGEGVIVEVDDRPAGWTFHTAFRRADFKLGSHSCPPRDATNVSLRRKIAHHQAERWLASRLPDDAQEGPR